MVSKTVIRAILTKDGPGKGKDADRSAKTFLSHFANSQLMGSLFSQLSGSGRCTKFRAVDSLSLNASDLPASA